MSENWLHFHVLHDLREDLGRDQCQTYQWSCWCRRVINGRRGEVRDNYDVVGDRFAIRRGHPRLGKNQSWASCKGEEKARITQGDAYVVGSESHEDDDWQKEQYELRENLNNTAKIVSSMETLAKEQEEQRPQWDIEVEIHSGRRNRARYMHPSRTSLSPRFTDVGFVV